MWCYNNQQGSSLQALQGGAQRKEGEEMYTFFMAVETVDDSHSNGTDASSAMSDAIELFTETGKSVKLRVCVMLNGEILYNASKNFAPVEFETVLIDEATK
jgi:hypothetical protein